MVLIERQKTRTKIDPFFDDPQNSKKETKHMEKTIQKHMASKKQGPKIDPYSCLRVLNLTTCTCTAHVGQNFMLIRFSLEFHHKNVRSFTSKLCNLPPFSSEEDGFCILCSDVVQCLVETMYFKCGVQHSSDAGLRR